VKALVLVACLAILLVPTSAAQAAEQVHLALTQDPAFLVVQWAVNAQDYGPTDTPVVRWQTTGGRLETASATRIGQVASGNAVVPQIPVSTYVYAATLGPFAPEAEVRYSVGSESRGFSAEFTTKVAPSGQSPLRFVTYGDIGVDAVAPDGTKAPGEAGYPAFDIRDLAIAQDPDLLVIPGDLAYNNQGTGWDSFMRFMQPIASKIPVMPTVGNHEWDPTLGYAQYLAEYMLPEDEMSYLFRAGPVTFIAVNSDNLCNNHARAHTGSPPRPCEDNQGGSVNTALLTWLEAALQAAQADTTPWTVVFHHHPPYSHGRHGSDWGAQTLLTPLYDKYGVDLVLTAHDHLYGRSFPIFNRQPAIVGTDDFPKGAGPVYLVVGGGGRSLYPYPETGAPDWHAKGESIHHLGIVDVNETRLHFQALRSDGSLLDEFWITSTETPANSKIATLPFLAPSFVVLAAVAALIVTRRRI
jgi:acid phosphatase type 7